MSSTPCCSPIFPRQPGDGQSHRSNPPVRQHAFPPPAFIDAASSCSLSAERARLGRSLLPRRAFGRSPRRHQKDAPVTRTVLPEIALRNLSGSETRGGLARRSMVLAATFTGRLPFPGPRWLPSGLPIRHQAMQPRTRSASERGPRTVRRRTADRCSGSQNPVAGLRSGATWTDECRDAPSEGRRGHQFVAWDAYGSI